MPDVLPAAVLFDLDGTLIDTAPDMGGALNNLLREENRAPLPLDAIRPYVSQGGLVLTKLGFGDTVPAAQIEPLRQRFLQHYLAIIADDSRLFAGFDAILDVTDFLIEQETKAMNPGATATVQAETATGSEGR